MFKEGSIGNMKDSKVEDICHYWAKVYDEPSEYGINGGRISKLMIQKGGVTTCNYDRGWDVEPKDEATQLALCILLNEYN